MSGALLLCASDHTSRLIAIPAGAARRRRAVARLLRLRHARRATRAALQFIINVNLFAIHAAHQQLCCASIRIQTLIFAARIPDYFNSAVLIA